ncbi:MAG: urease accessory protein [Myxococcales bacterium]|nr:urease accessory protein [Myxococcales bacterium]
MLAGVLWLGFLLGLRHAFEADHLAAVTSLSSRVSRRRDMLRIAAAWGLGHTLTLTAAGTVIVAAGIAWSPDGRWAHAGELLAGGVLVWLGADVLRRAVRSHSDATVTAAPTFASRALLVGGLHGLEGSGAVVLIALPALRSTTQAFVYLGLFGAGSILGMLASSLAMSLPLGFAARRWTWSTRALQFGVGATSIILGGAMAITALP